MGRVGPVESSWPSRIIPDSRRRPIADLFQAARHRATIRTEPVVAHKKGQGSSKNGRDSNAQYRGIKLYGGQVAKAGSIIVRQCGTRFKPGYLVQRCKDDTLMARVEGTVRFRGRMVDVVPADPSIPRYEVIDKAVAAKKN